MTHGARRRVEEALRLLGADAASADALTRADALWLARVLPEGEDAQLDGEALATLGGEPLRDFELAPHTPIDTFPRQAEAHEATGDSTAPAIESESPPPVQAHEDQDVALFVHQPGEGGEPQLHARRVPVPAADALPGRAAFERALRPFLRRRPSRTRQMLDAGATAEASAQAGADALASSGTGLSARRTMALVPVLRPVPERWFDLLLLAEQDDTMRVFDDTLKELRQLLARHGAFRRVGLWHWSVRDGAVHVQTASAMACAPRAMLQGQHPQLVWVLTHGASNQWSRSELRDFVRGLAQRAVVAIMQVLPETAWGATALGESQERVRSRERAAINRQLLTQDGWTGTWARDGAHTIVPMLPLRAEAIARWADFVMAPRSLEHAAVLIEAQPPELPHRPGSSSADSLPAIREQVLRFRAVASPAAFALLRLLSGAWVTLPVMRLLQQSLPGSRVALAPMAEVLLSGLLKRTTPFDARVEELAFDFAPGVRDWLAGSLSGAEQRALDAALAESREAIRRFVEEKTGRKLANFSALLLDEEGAELLPRSARSFVEVSRRLRSLKASSSPMPKPVADQPVATEPEPEPVDPQRASDADHALQRAWTIWRDTNTNLTWVEALVALSRAPQTGYGLSLATAISGLKDENALAQLISSAGDLGLLDYDATLGRLKARGDHVVRGQPGPDAHAVLGRITDWFTLRFAAPDDERGVAWHEIQEESDALEMWLGSAPIEGNLLHAAIVGTDYALANGPFDGWIDFYKRCLGEVELSKQEGLARCLVLLLRQAGDLVGALEAVQQLRNIVTELREDYGRHASLYADILSALGRYDEARAVRELEELPFLERMRDERGQVAAMLALANDCEELGLASQALTTLRRDAYPLCKKIGQDSLTNAVLERTSALEKRLQRSGSEPTRGKAIFISAVASELGDYVRGLKEALNHADIRVVILDDYQTDGVSALLQIDDIIQDCAFVIHLVGDCCDTAANADAVRALLQRYPGLDARLCELGAWSMETVRQLPYQQWEAWLALKNGKRLYVARPAPGAPRRNRARDAEQLTRQRLHLQALRRARSFKQDVEFETMQVLIGQVFDWITLDKLDLDDPFALLFGSPAAFDPFAQPPSGITSPSGDARPASTKEASWTWPWLPQVEPGAKFSNYEIVGRLSANEECVFYEARDLSAGRPVALKTRATQGVSKILADQFRQHFQIEAREAARLKHPSIAKVYAAGHDQGTDFLAMELPAGGTLMEMLDGGKALGFAGSVRIMQQLLEALSFAHAQGILHQRVNPTNVMMDAFGRVKLGNFDFMGLVDVPDITRILLSDDVPYRSPEKVGNDHSVDHRSDLFSAGAVLYRILTGVQPFGGSTSFDINRAITEGHFAAPSTLQLDLPREIDDIIAKALAKDPDERFASAAEFSAALQELAAQTGALSEDADGFQGFMSRVLDPVEDATDSPANLEIQTGEFVAGTADTEQPWPAAGALKTLGRYTILQPLDAGEMGTVYKAQAPDSGRLVAIKTIRVDRLSTSHAELYETRFRAEVEIGSQLKHPHIVEILDSGFDQGSAFLVMELIEGGDVKQLMLNSARLTFARSIDIMEQLLSALAHAHDLGLIHRDIKPANVMLDAKGGVKLGDFGLASTLKEQADDTLTRPLDVGTTSYMSPEQLHGRPLDQRSDLFAAGVMLYEMLTGSRPFQGTSQFAIMQAIVTTEPVPPSSLNPELPPGIDAILATALAKEPERRFASAQEFAQALRAVPGS